MTLESLARRVRRGLRDRPRGYAGAKWVYRNLLWPLCSGFLFRWCRYAAADRRADRRALLAAGIEGPRPCRRRSWHYRRKGEDRFRRYYTGYRQGEKLFIKLASDDGETVNERRTLEALGPFRPGFIPEPVLWDGAIRPGTALLASRYIEGLRPVRFPMPEEEFTALCGEIADILDFLDEHGLVHTDIFAGNLLRDAAGRAVLLDFGRCHGPGLGGGVDYGIDLVAAFRREGDSRVFDDAYAVAAMFAALDMPGEFAPLPAWQAVLAREGRRVFRTQIGTEQNL